MKKILVTGANGLLGCMLKDISTQFKSFEFHFLSKKDLAIDKYEDVENFFKKFRPDFCINCAAYTSVDKAEEEKKLCFRINAESVQFLAMISKLYCCKFIHLSTDYVFSGEGVKPFKETDMPNPLSIYGMSKLAGEEMLMKENPGSVIIRTSWLYCLNGYNFLTMMIKLLKEKKDIYLVKDQVGSPTWVNDLAFFIMYLINKTSWKPGIYHFSNLGYVSRFDFTLEISKFIRSTAKIHPIQSHEYDSKALRPKFSALDISKVQYELSYDVIPWKISLHKCLNSLIHNNYN
jgi:dTDP-4-dehydrorhamnose reductase